MSPDRRASMASARKAGKSTAANRVAESIAPERSTGTSETIADSPSARVSRRMSNQAESARTRAREAASSGPSQA